MKFRKLLYLFVSITLINHVCAQNKFDNFLKPSDSLDKIRLKTLAISEGVIMTAGLIGLNQLWYKNYPRSDFHFINDNADWLQMDKIGHLYSAYHIGRLSAESFKWAGATKKTQLIYGATAGFVFLSIVEVFDGYSAQWGASTGDIFANTSGTLLYVGQELIWNEQRITPKFSFHTTEYAPLRPNVLGSSVTEQILKDYNGQTYWLSANLKSFFKTTEIPKWLNIAVGYGATGMITGNESTIINNFSPNQTRNRHFYLSLDVDLTKINTKSSILKTFFSVFNSVKIPAPTIEISGSGKFNWHAFYF